MRHFPPTMLFTALLSTGPHRLQYKTVHLWYWYQYSIQFSRNQSHLHPFSKNTLPILHYAGEGNRCLQNEATIIRSLYRRFFIFAQKVHSLRLHISFPFLGFLHFPALISTLKSTFATVFSLFLTSNHLYFSKLCTCLI